MMPRGIINQDQGIIGQMRQGEAGLFNAILFMAREVRIMAVEIKGVNLVSRIRPQVVMRMRMNNLNGKASCPRSRKVAMARVKIDADEFAAMMFQEQAEQVG